VEIPVLIISSIVLGVLLSFLLKNKGGKIKHTQPEQAARGRPCPLCGSLLQKGQRVHTVVYSSSPSAPDKLVHMFGCPYCFPRKEEDLLLPRDGEIPRFCPACKKEIAREGYVVARMFDKKPKPHVHVLGCTGCRKT
jgi:hypothetical protein